MSNKELFEQFNNAFDLEGLKQDVEAAASSDGDFVDVPCGSYEIKVSKLELGVTGDKSKNPGMPMVKVWFDIVAGDFKGQKIFMNQMVHKGFGLHKMNEFLVSLETSQEIKFGDFEQYAELLEAVFNELDRDGAEFQLDYGENNKGFKTYTIVQRF